MEELCIIQKWSGEWSGGDRLNGNLRSALWRWSLILGILFPSSPQVTSSAVSL